MHVTEKNIFDYVFFKDTLASEKITEIEENTNFENQLEFYKKLKENLSQGISNNTRKKLASKIPAYNFAKIISLFPQVLPDTSKKINLLKYAAASEVDTKASVLTYINEDKNYLVRLHKEENKYKIFVFSTLQEILKNLQLTFSPSGETISLKDNQSPFLISLSQMPDKIEVRLN